MERGLHMNQREIKVTYIANAGVLITSGQTKIFIDALHSEKTPVFSTLSEPLLSQIVAGEGPFKDVDYLLVTHNHLDHFGVQATSNYLRNNKVKALVVPHDVAEIIRNKMPGEQKNATETIVMQSSYGEIVQLIRDELRIKYFRTVHQGEQFTNVQNYGILLKIAGYTILHLGDGGYEPESLEKMLQGETIDCALLNFPFITLPLGRRIITGVIKPRKIITLHLPTTADDQFNYRKVTAKTISKYEEQLPKVVAFWDPLQEEVLEL